MLNFSNSPLTLLLRFFTEGNSTLHAHCFSTCSVRWSFVCTSTQWHFVRINTQWCFIRINTHWCFICASNDLLCGTSERTCILSATRWSRYNAFISRNRLFRFFFFDVLVGHISSWLCWDTVSNSVMRLSVWVVGQFSDIGTRDRLFALFSQILVVIGVFRLFYFFNSLTSGYIVLDRMICSGLNFF